MKCRGYIQPSNNSKLPEAPINADSITGPGYTKAYGTNLYLAMEVAPEVLACRTRDDELQWFEHYGETSIQIFVVKGYFYKIKKLVQKQCEFCELDITWRD